MLTQEIREETDNRWNLIRFYDSVKTLCKKKGVFIGGASTVSLVTAELFAGFIFFYCLDGSIISFKEMSHEKRPLINLRAYGDAGGWLPICILIVISSKSFFEKFCGEAEYLKCQSLLEKRIKKGHSLSEETVSLILKEYASKCLFKESLALQKIRMTQYASGSQYESIVPSLQRLDKKIRKKLNPFNYVPRLIKGGQSIYKTKKMGGLLVSAIMGIALPTFLMLFGVFSLIGLVGLCTEIFNKKTSLDDTGHIGEWFFNTFAAACAAYLLHNSYIRKEGDYVIVSEIYEKEIDSLRKDVEGNYQEKVTLLLEMKREELACKNTHYKKID